MSRDELAILNNLFDTLPSGLLIFEPEGTVIRFNQRGKEILAVQGPPFPERIQDFPEYLKPLGQLLLSETGDVHRAEMTLTFPNKGEPVIIGYSLKCVPEMCDAARILTFSDITQVVQERLMLDRIQAELHQAKKLASLGTLVAGVAHELNNPLTGISMSIGLIKMNLERLCALPCVQNEAVLSNRLEQALTEVGKVLRANEKASVLVNDLLAYSKPSQLVLVPLPLENLVRDIVNAFKNHPQLSQLRFQVEDGTPHSVLCDRVKLEQVFYNLFKNASDATGGTGKITVRFTDTQLNGRAAVVIHVRDNGPGIDADSLSRIFDPFFTTKGHCGVGLGLSISYRTLEQHGGLLSVTSEPGCGAEFTLTLPIYLEEAHNKQ